MLNSQAFVNIENLTGGSGSDTFVFSDGAAVTGIIDGGDGINTLDYSAYTTGVTVDLGASIATGTAGLSNIQNVTGGSGNDAELYRLRFREHRTRWCYHFLLFQNGGSSCYIFRQGSSDNGNNQRSDRGLG